MSQVESFWHWKTPACQFEYCQSPTHSVYRHHILFQAYVLPEPSFSMVAENYLGAELDSGCGVLSTWTEDLQPCFVWVLNMLDCIILGSMHIGQVVTKQGFPLDLLDKLMICEVNEPSGVFLSLEDPCRPILILPFTHTLSSPGITYTFRHMCCQSHHVAW